MHRSFAIGHRDHPQFNRHGRIVSLLALAVSACGTGWAQTPPVPLYGPSGISPAAVRQGTLGSCYFHASLAAVAKAAPGVIRAGIVGEMQRGFQVHFVSGPQELVYKADVDYARSHNYDRSDGAWVTVMMRGYAQRELRHSMIEAVQRSTMIPSFAKPAAIGILNEPGPLLLAYDRAVRSVVNQNGQMDRASFEANLAKELQTLGVPPAKAQAIGALLDRGGLYAAINSTVQKNGEVFGAYRSLGQGGIPFSVLEALLGSAHSAPMNNNVLDAELRGAHDGTTAMVAGTKTSAYSGSGPEWYVPGHAYTVLDYDQGSRQVLLRNPWGGHPGPDGVFRLPLSTFREAFETFSYHDGSE